MRTVHWHSSKNKFSCIFHCRRRRRNGFRTNTKRKCDLKHTSSVRFDFMFWTTSTAKRKTNSFHGGQRSISHRFHWTRSPMLRRWFKISELKIRMTYTPSKYNEQPLKAEPHQYFNATAEEKRSVGQRFFFEKKKKKHKSSAKPHAWELTEKWLYSNGQFNDHYAVRTSHLTTWLSGEANSKSKTERVSGIFAEKFILTSRCRRLTFANKAFWAIRGRGICIAYSLHEFWQLFLSPVGHDARHPKPTSRSCDDRRWRWWWAAEKNNNLNMNSIFILGVESSWASVCAWSASFFLLRSTWFAGMSRFPISHTINRTTEQRWYITIFDWNCVGLQTIRNSAKRNVPAMESVSAWNESQNCIERGDEVILIWIWIEIKLFRTINAFSISSVLFLEFECNQKRKTNEPD